MTDRTIEGVAIAKTLLPGLLLCLGGICLAYLIPRFVARTGMARRQLWSRAFRLSTLALITAIACQPLKTTGDTLSDHGFNLLPGQPPLTIAQSYRANITLGEANVAIGGGGYVTGIYFHPRERDLVYIRTDVGGFYRWNPQNQRWIPITDRFSLDEKNYYGGEGLALDPNDPDIVYIAAGKYLWDDPGAIFKSSDRGQTWRKLDLELPMGANQHKRWTGERLVVNPSDSQVIFFGSRRDGLWKSTDAGESWGKVNAFPGKPVTDIGISAIAFDPQVPGLVYANAYGDGLYASADLGDTWRKLPDSPEQIHRIAIASNGTLYATLDDEGGVSKYVDGNWTTITPEPFESGFCGLSINPANPDELLVSQDQTERTVIYHSTDGGATWTKKKASINNTVPWWPRRFFANHVAAIEFDPNVPNRVWFTDWFGVWRTDEIQERTVSWTNYVKGHEELVTFDLVSPPEGTLLLSGVADVDGFNHHNGLDAYPSETFGGSGPLFQATFSIAYSASNPSHIVRVGGNQWNSTYTGATSEDGGRSWRRFGSFPGETMPLRVAVSATKPERFVVSVSEGQPIRTQDNGESWEQVIGLPDGPQGPWNWSQSLAADTVNGDIFYYYAKGKVYRSTDGGASFAVVRDSLPQEGWHALKTLPGVEGEIWLSLDRQGLYRSTDGGGSFSQIPNVERSHLFAFGKPPANSTTPALYLYGEIQGQGEGIFRSFDRGKTWTQISNPDRPIGNEPNVMEASKQVFGLVFVGTNGRGIYYGT